MNGHCDLLIADRRLSPRPALILKQSDSGASSVETRTASVHAMVSDTPHAYAPLAALSEYAGALRRGDALPIGSVEFVRGAMRLANIDESDNLSYPESLRPYLYREIQRREAGSLTGRWFVKPVSTKLFTGFLLDALGRPDRLSDHDRAQHDVFIGLPPDTPVWVSEPVSWVSEWRYYVGHGRILGAGRYDDGPDEAPIPDAGQVEQMIAAMDYGGNGPSSYALDVGVLDSGETALVECNDAWALGYYKGTLLAGDYIQMLWWRWTQMFRSASSAVR